MFEVVILTYQIVGIWIFYDPKRLRWYQFVYSIIALTYLTIFIFTELLELRNTIQNVEKLVDQLSIFLTHIVGFIKLIVMCVERKNILRIMNEFVDMQKYWLGFNETSKTRLEKASKDVRKVMIMFTSVAIVISSATQLMQLFGVVFANEEVFEKDENGCKMFLTVHSTILFATPTKYYCLCAWVSQTIAILICCLAITGGDTTFFAYSMCLTSNAKALQDNFRNIRKIAGEKLKLLSDPKNAIGDDDLFVAPELSKLMDEEMRKCSKHLQWLIKITDDIERIFNLIILVQMLCALFTLMSCLFIAATADVFSTTFLLEAQLYFIFAFQISMYCIFGNEVEAAFSELPNAIYNSSWYCASSSFKKSIVINMIRLNKPIGLTVGKFTYLTLALLVKILRMSYSFFAVLKK